MHGFIRHTAVFYLMVLVFLKVLAIPAVYLHYQLNKAYIASVLCENKSKPIMHCSGKCHLRKQLAKTSDTSDSQSPKGATSFQLIDFCETIETYSFNSAESVSQNFTSQQIKNTAAGHYGNVFHPPII